jgi:dihydroorotase-like cyclic amidohydrolase
LWSELPGVVAFRWELPLLVSHGVLGRGLTLQQLTTLNSYAPACRFGFYPRKGSLEVGTDADLVLVDLDAERTVHHEGHGTCIYEGWQLKGWPVLTVSSGRIICEGGEVDEAAFGTGRCLTRPA